MQHAAYVHGSRAAARAGDWFSVPELAARLHTHTHIDRVPFGFVVSSCAYTCELMATRAHSRLIACVCVYYVANSTSSGKRTHSPFIAYQSNKRGQRAWLVHIHKPKKSVTYALLACLHEPRAKRQRSFPSTSHLLQADTYGSGSETMREDLFAYVGRSCEREPKTLIHSKIRAYSKSQPAAKPCLTITITLACGKRRDLLRHQYVIIALRARDDFTIGRTLRLALSVSPKVRRVRALT